MSVMDKLNLAGAPIACCEHLLRESGASGKNVRYCDAHEIVMCSACFAEHVESCNAPKTYFARFAADRAVLAEGQGGAQSQTPAERVAPK